jgi:copper chaperone CopZ
MKKVNLFSMLIVAVVMMLGLTNCKKELKDSTPESKQYVEAIAASFNVVPAIEITTKALTPTITLVSQNMYMYTSNVTFYSITPSNPFELVRGLEFLVGSAGQQWWSITANNPASFPANQSVYSNLTPDENVRVVVEGTSADSKIAYIGANDFNPNAAQFPLNIKQYRLGDYLSIYAYAITSLPGVTSVSVSFDTKAIDLPATRIGSITGAGNTLCFDDIKLGTLITNHTVIIPNLQGSFDLYYDVLDKVVGNIVITISAGGNPVAITLPPISATALGHGMNISLSTAKVGWFDSATMQMTPADIDVTTTYVSVN